MIDRRLREPWLAPSDYPEQRRGENFDEAWHYTDEAGLRGILASKSLWASSHRALNDTSEISFGVSAVRAAWEQSVPRLVKGIPVDLISSWLDEVESLANTLEFFFVSATIHGDSLEHWKFYASGDKPGLAIGFAPDAEFRILAPPGSPQLFQPDYIPTLYWRQIQYGNFDLDWTERVDNKIWETISFALGWYSNLAAGRVSDEKRMQNALAYVYLATVAAIKHVAFAHENEIRIIAVEPPFPNLAQTGNGKYGAKRFMPLVAASEELVNYSSFERRKLPITSVRVGPGEGAIERERTARTLLNDAGLESVPVLRSSIPFR
ncbi:hypothetical protein GCM10007382_28600 [Salinibacterium xinjiangense]|uniref:DUF2971 domain-containing protein n=1 Tax=Salinibacterium xinjiangense TaxID=386302 RepID=A0A2C8ZTC6_9MICO|nr:hypothetical protein [Salinibacterium xinjiangense]GGL06836.1 hypothetical protein GCM10007382_28600 [Salinibacterium xinjiangense]SOE68823.1 hypothetical protein SAMN06296378_1845 [Salinibacterium xinjiangense]